jgi:hypothetical protein
MYNAEQLAAEYCGLHVVPHSIDGHWQHGWVPKYQAVNDTIVVNGMRDPRPLKQKHKFFVARIDHREYLESHGYNHVFCIGMPIVYLPMVEREEKPRTLLVMPVHSGDLSALSVDEAEYVASIDRIREQFSDVLVMIHPSCVRKGYWVNTFEAHDYPIIIGAGWNDKNALSRLRHIMTKFDCLTTNGFGSHVVYGAYFGMRVSIYGPEYKRKSSDFEHDKSKMELSDAEFKTLLRSAENSSLANAFPFLFCDPHESRRHESWGKTEIGFENKRAPEQLRELFQWRITDAISRIPGQIAKRISIDISHRLTPAVFKDKSESFLNQERKESKYSIPSIKLGKLENAVAIDASGEAWTYSRSLLKSHENLRLIILDPLIFGNKQPKFKREKVEIRNSVIDVGQVLAAKKLQFCTLTSSAKSSTLDHILTTKTIKLADYNYSSLVFLRFSVCDEDVDYIISNYGIIEAKFVAVRYISLIGAQSKLPELLAYLRQQNFHIYLENRLPRSKPFEGADFENFWVDRDLDLEVFCVKKG